jgi:NADPH-dependent curcumin reductase CurA
MTNSKQIVLRERPTTGIDPDLKNGTFAEKIVQVEEGKTPEGHILVKVLYCSIDPAMRGWLRDIRSYLPPVQIGEVMRAGGVGEVIESRSSDFKKGDRVSGVFGWQEYATVPAQGVTKLEDVEGVDIQDYLGVLGSSGLTAYFGAYNILGVQAGEVVVVTGAAGSVGSIVVQLCKIKGCKVIATAGTDEKCAWIKETLGADEALNYKSPNFEEEFRDVVKNKYHFAHCVFENVGGPQLDLSLTLMRPFGRIAFCGSISQYNSAEPYRIKNYQSIVGMRIRLQGFIVFDFAKEYPKAIKEMNQWIQEKKLIRHYHLIEGGVEKGPLALISLFEGKNQGKTLVKL